MVCSILTLSPLPLVSAFCYYSARVCSFKTTRPVGGFVQKSDIPTMHFVLLWYFCSCIDVKSYWCMCSIQLYHCGPRLSRIDVIAGDHSEEEVVWFRSD